MREAGRHRRAGLHDSRCGRGCAFPRTRDHRRGRTTPNSARVPMHNIVPRLSRTAGRLAAPRAAPRRAYRCRPRRSGVRCRCHREVAKRGRRGMMECQGAVPHENPDPSSEARANGSDLGRPDDRLREPRRTTARAVPRAHLRHRDDGSWGVRAANCAPKLRPTSPAVPLPPRASAGGVVDQRRERGAHLGVIGIEPGDFLRRRAGRARSGAGRSAPASGSRSRERLLAARRPPARRVTSTRFSMRMP